MNPGVYVLAHIYVRRSLEGVCIAVELLGRGSVRNNSKWPSKVVAPVYTLVESVQVTVVLGIIRLRSCHTGGCGVVFLCGLHLDLLIT